MATKKTVKAAPDEVKEEVKVDLLGEAKSKKYVPSGGPFAPRRDGPFVPATRLEEFLFAIAVADPDACPEPVTRIEYLLNGIVWALSERATYGDLEGFVLPDYSEALVGEVLTIGSDHFPEWT